MLSTFRRWPLRTQILCGTIGIVITSQILTMALVFMLLVRPQVDRIAQMMAQNISVLSETLDTIPPENRATLMQKLKASPYLELWDGASPPDRSGPPPRFMDRAFMNALAERLPPTSTDQSHIYWRTDHNRKLWVQVVLGGQAHWISLKSQRLGPNGTLISLGIMALGLALLAAIWLSHVLLKPLRDLQAANENLSLTSHNLASPRLILSEDGPREVAELGKSFNTMAHRLEQAEADRTLVLAGISHDLRTPLAKLRLALEMADIRDKDLSETASRQVDTIERILSQFMQFARGFGAEQPGLIDPDQLIEDLLADYGKNGVRRGPGHIVKPFTARPEAIRRAFTNLIENALHYGKAPVDICIRHTGDGIVLCVNDKGQGMSDEESLRLRQPFARGDVARQPMMGEAKEQPIPINGTGLGLAMVEQIAHLHGGRLDFLTTSEGFEARLIVPT